MWMLLACAAPEVVDDESDRGGVASDGEPIEEVDEADPGDDVEDAEEETGALDDAAVVDADFPSAVACGESSWATVSVENTGTTAWTKDLLYKLGTVDDDDPFHGHSTRVYLDDDVEVLPGEVHDFEIELTAPDGEGTYTSDWQMVLEHTYWFGEIVSVDIEVTCESDEPPPLDLGDVTWLHTDVSGWDVTTSISSVSVDSSEICFPYGAADTWPVLDFDGTELVGNPWIFIWHDDQWYGATWEWLRPGQTCKARTSVAGDHIKQSPFDADSGWTPTSGQLYYLMVSAFARDSTRSVYERSEPVPFVWP